VEEMRMKIISFARLV